MKTHDFKAPIYSMNLGKFKKSAALCISVILIISIFAASVAHVSASSVFFSGFEDGFNGWSSSSGGVSVVSSPVYSGSYAMRAEYWGSQATVLIGSQSETYAEAEFYFDRDVVGQQTLIAFFNANGQPTVSMGISVQSGSVYVFVQTILPSYSYSQFRLSGIAPGTWSKFALDASASLATIYLNGQQLRAISQTNIPVTSKVSVGLFWGDSGYTGNVYVDNVQIDTSLPTSSPTPSPSPTTVPTSSPSPTPTQTATPIPTPTSTPTPTPSPTPTPTPTPTGSSVFFSGFEDGFNGWSSSSGGVSVVSSPVYSGSYAMRAEYWGSQATVLIGSQSETYAEAEFYFDRDVVGQQTLIAFFNANGQPTVSMGISVQSGSVYVFVQTILPSYSYSQFRLSGIAPGTWSKFALDASASLATIYLNGQQLRAISQTNIPVTSKVSVGLFWGDSGYTGNVYVDNVQIDTSLPTSSPTPSPSPTTVPTSSPSPTPTQTATPIPTPTSTPTPTPSPTPTPTPTTNSLPLSCLGDDYLVYSNFNGDPSYWNTQTHWFTQFHCNTAKLGISFADETAQGCSTYNKTKLEAVLTILNSVGVKVILANDNGPYPESWFGSQAWINDWKQVTIDFKGDIRIIAFELAGECYNWYWDNNSPFGAYGLHNFDSACSALINQIRAIDSSRTIMYSIVMGIFTSSATTFYNDLVSTGVIAQGNMLYDIVHPYYFQQYPNLDPVNDPVGDAEWYWNNYCLPQISYFGASNVYCGETFPFASTAPISGNPANGYYNNTSQQQFEITIINHFVSVGMGFQMMFFFSAQNQQPLIDSLTNSNYGTLILGSNQATIGLQSVALAAPNLTTAFPDFGAKTFPQVPFSAYSILWIASSFAGLGLGVKVLLLGFYYSLIFLVPILKRKINLSTNSLARSHYFVNRNLCVL